MNDLLPPFARLGIWCPALVCMLVCSDIPHETTLMYSMNGSVWPLFLPSMHATSL